MSDDLRTTKATAWREARWWCVSQIPVAFVVMALAIGMLVGLRKPWPVLVGDAGLAVSTLAAYWLASSLFPSDAEAAEMDLIAGLNRSPAALRERAKATISTGVLVVGFVLQYVSFMLTDTAESAAAAQTGSAPQAQIAQPEATPAGPVVVSAQTQGGTANVDWLDAHAGAVQAVAAGVTVLVTIVLAGITIYYAVQTRRQVTAAKGQLQELRDARAATYRPVIRGVGAGYTSGGAQPFTAQLRVANLGNGPAVDLELNDADLFTCEPLRVIVPAHEERPLTLTAKGQGSQMQFNVPLAYRDLADLRCVTTVGVDLERQGGPESKIVRHETQCG
jgi:hypothetical protein